VLALGEHGTLVALHVFEARAEEFRDLGGGEPRADVRLDVARARPRCARLGVALHTTQLRAEGLIDLQGESFARLGRDDENALFDSDDFELLHARRASRSLRRHRTAAPRPC
jgi:hypothetical protein